MAAAVLAGLCAGIDCGGSSGSGASGDAGSDATGAGDAEGGPNDASDGAVGAGDGAGDADDASEGGGGPNDASDGAIGASDGASDAGDAGDGGSDATDGSSETGDGSSDAGPGSTAPCTWPGNGVPTVVSVPADGGAATAGNGVIARAGNGHVLAIWTETPNNQTEMFGAEFDGTKWGQPVDLGPGQSAPTVAATAATFVVAWSVNGVRYAARWTGSGLSTPANLGSSFALGSLRVASDGSRLVAVWSAQQAVNSSTGLWSSTSTDDGMTWGSAVVVEPESGYGLLGLVGGPAGVATLESLPTGMIATRVATGGVWGAASNAMQANVNANGAACEVSVGTADALVACVGPSATDAQRFAGGAWTDHPLASPAGSLFSLGTDGADYRIDYVYGASALSSTIFHAGAWSTPVTSATIAPLPTAPKSNFTAGACGVWTLLYDTSANLSGTLYATQASGAAGYPQGAQLVAGQATAFRPLMATWPGVVDAVWSGASPTSGGVSVLYVDLNVH